MHQDPKFAENHYTDKSELKSMAGKYTHSENFLDLLLCRCTKNILGSLRVGPKSTLQLCKELKMQPSTAYRTMQKLHNCGFVKRVYAIDSTGKKVGLYKIRFGATQCQ